MKNGQALITLIFFMAIVITITSAAVVANFINSLNTHKLEQGEETLSIAESGAENALLRLLRNSSYTGETLSVGEGTVTIQITGNDPKIVTSEAHLRNFTRTVEVIAGYTNNILTVQSWKELSQ